MKVRTEWTRPAIVRYGMMIALLAFVAGFPFATGTQEDAVEDAPLVRIFQGAQESENERQLAFITAFTEETGIQTEFNAVPGSGPERYQKIDIALLSGDETEIIYLNNANIQTRYSDAGFLMDLRTFIEQDDMDVDAMFGPYLTRERDGAIYHLPVNASPSAVFYNKALFDEAGVDYPSGPWTWDEYISTAKALTDPEAGVYGSLMMNWEYYTYVHANQRGFDFYNADGSSNLDDPAIADSLQWFGDLAAVHGIQPSWLEMKTNNVAWDAFTSGEYGLHFIGAWMLNILTNYNDWPRDWQWGIAPMPTFEDGRRVIANIATIGVNANATYADAAWEFLKYDIENHYRDFSLIPARVDLGREELEAHFAEIAEASRGSITSGDLIAALVEHGHEVVPEKISGPASAEINAIVLEEAELYLIGEKTVEEAQASMKRRADDAINNAQ